MTGSSDPVVTRYADAPTRTLEAGGVTYAYRELGPRGGVPVVFFVHLAATLDNWDPRIVDAVAAHRHVVAFDQRGVGASSGKVPSSIEAMADDAHAFVTALGFEQIDVFAFSMGGMIAQDLVVEHPRLVRKLVLTGTGPRGGKDMDKVARTTYYDILRATLTRSDPKEFLFFNRNTTGKHAAKAFVARLQERVTDRDATITTSAFRAQLRAIEEFGRSDPSDLSTLTHPTLIANGDHDRMVPNGRRRPHRPLVPWRVTVTSIAARTVLVTGANRGLGREFVDQFLARGAARVYAAAREPGSVRSDDPRVVAIALDVTDPASIRAAATATGDVDIVVNNAGIANTASLLDPDPTALRRELEVDLFGPLAVTAAFADQVAARGGAVVNVASALSWIALAGSYSVAKAGLWAATDSLRLQLAPRGVQVLGLFMGYVDTDMTAGVTDPKSVPADIVRQALDGLEAGEAEVLADQTARDVRATLHRPVAERYAAFLTPAPA